MGLADYVPARLLPVEASDLRGIGYELEAIDSVKRDQFFFELRFTPEPPSPFTLVMLGRGKGVPDFRKSLGGRRAQKMDMAVWNMTFHALYS